MSLKSIFENITQKFSSDTKMQEYEEILHKYVDASFTLNEASLPHYFVSLKRGADINVVKEIYAKVGIKLRQQMMRSSNRFIPILCISKIDFGKLTDKQREFFERTTNKDRIHR